MKTFTATEARTHFCAIIRSVQQGEIAQITRRGKPVMRIEPPQSASLKVGTNSPTDAGLEAVQKRIAELRAAKLRTAAAARPRKKKK